MDKVQVCLNAQLLIINRLFQLNKKSFILEKILINEVPKLGDEKDKKAKPTADSKGEGFRPYIQIFKGSKAIFNYLSKYLLLWKTMC